MSANAREGTDAVVNVKVRRRFKTDEANATFMIAQDGVIPTPTPTPTEPAPTPTGTEPTPMSTPVITPEPGGSRVITTANIPIIGDFEEIAVVGNAIIDPGPGGANQTWDFSDLTETEEGFVQYLEPSETTFGDDFPSATLAVLNMIVDTNAPDAFSYFKLTNGIYELIGFAATNEDLDPPNNTAITIFNNTQELFRLPAEFGDSFTDTFASKTEVSGFTANTTGTSQSEADGSGTLILPIGTFPNVVRFHSQTEQETIASGIATGSTITVELFSWLSADHRAFPLMQITTTTSTPPGTTSISTFYDKNPIPSQ